MVAEQNATGGVINRFDRGAGWRIIRSEHHGWYLHNKRGDVVQRTNASGAVTHTYRYTAFGMELSGNQSANTGSNNPWRFAGEYWDAHTQTYYLRARHFNPRRGRFTQPDPFWNISNMQGSNSAILQASNLFVFTMNNPVRFIDPSGMVAMPVALQGMGGIHSRIVDIVNQMRTAAQAASAARANPPSLPELDGGFLTPDELAAGVTITLINGVMFRNLSVPVNAALTRSANEARARRPGVPPVNNTRNFIIATPSDYLWILENFAAGQRWDFKDPEAWERQFPDIPFHGEYGHFVVNGVLMKPADLGNVHFGYVTSALGVPIPIQLVGAGVAHIRDHGLYHIENLLHFGDSPRCRYFTDMGRRWYRHGRNR